MGLLAKASVAIDGSKFKAVNSRDNNFTKGKMERRLAQIEESVARYLSQLDTADRQTASGEAPSEELVARTTRLKEKLIKLEEEVKRLKAIEKVMLAAPDQQVSFTDPDSRSMATSGRGSGMVGYNVQAAVDTTNHLIVAHEVTNVGTDKSHLANIANQAKAALEAENLEAFADRGYFKGEEIRPFNKTLHHSPAIQQRNHTIGGVFTQAGPKANFRPTDRHIREAQGPC
jgi:DDE family transposase